MKKKDNYANKMFLTKNSKIVHVKIWKRISCHIIVNCSYYRSINDIIVKEATNNGRINTLQS